MERYDQCKCSLTDGDEITRAVVLSEFDVFFKGPACEIYQQSRELVYLRNCFLFLNSKHFHLLKFRFFTFVLVFTWALHHKWSLHVSTLFQSTL